jgi:anti-sigma regulatory factor (Ser/Thr protein kinase)
MRWQRAIVRRRGDIVPVIESVVATLEGLRYSARDRRHVRLAVEEAIVNGLLHGNHNDPARCVQVRHCASRAGVLIEVEDDGRGFDPRRVPDPTRWPQPDRPTGRGLLLMQHCMTWVRFSPRGNLVMLYKRNSATE